VLVFTISVSIAIHLCIKITHAMLITVRRWS